MFDLCEWNDQAEAQTLSSSVINTKKRSAPTLQEQGAPGRRKRQKRNRQLQEVLRSLKSPSDQNAELHPPPPQPRLQPSDKARPQGKTADVTPMSSENPPLSTEAPPLDAANKLSRQQWRNRMKNKRKQRNKFKPPAEKPERVEESGQDGEKPGSGGKKRGRGKEDGAGLPEVTSRRVTSQEKVRLKKLKRLLQREGATEGQKVSAASEDPEDMAASDPDLPQEEEPGVGEEPPASLRSRMEQRLTSARFRYINEQLYTSESRQAARLFQGDPEAFSIYHSGFSQQVQRWPTNPLTQVIKSIKNRPASLVVADFGCGDAQLARSVKNKVHSFDLVALNNHVTACDMAKVPLEEESVDIGVFCLSLMGTNLGDFLREANRVLKPEGTLLVAEVRSRFDDVRPFLTAMAQLGFKSVSKTMENSHFYLFEFSKVGPARSASKHPGLHLKPCLYKKR